MRYRVFTLTLLLITFYNCEELIEVEDISNEAVIILAPADAITLNSSTVNFSWQPLEFAEAYQLQIALPNFDTAQEIVKDTLISVTRYSKILSEGNYEWRIKATNFGYETPYTAQHLTIEN
jgi:hypothetical protein